MNFLPNFQGDKIPPIFQESKYENFPYFEIVDFPPNFQVDKIYRTFQIVRNSSIFRVTISNDS